MAPQQQPNDDPPPRPVLTPVEEPIPYVGVPEGYYATRRFEGDWGAESRRPGGGLAYNPTSRGTLNVPVEPTFLEGDEFLVYGYHPERIATMQARLVQAGLLDEDDYQPGFVGGGDNDPTLAAIRMVMSYGNRAGYRTVDSALSAYIASGGGPKVDAEDERLPAPVSNTDDLRRVFRAAVIDTLGQGWSQSQIDAMVDNYQAAERTFNAAVAAGEPIDEQLASPETFAVEAARAADPTGAQSAEFLDVGNQLMSMLGGWSPT